MGYYTDKSHIDTMFHKFLNVAKRIAVALEKLAGVKPPTSSQPFPFSVSIGPGVPDTYKGPMHMDTIKSKLSTVEMKNIVLTPRNTSTKKPKPIDGIPVWSSEGSASIEPAADGLSCLVHGSPSEDGDITNVHATVDTKEGPEIETLTQDFEFTSEAPTVNDLGAVVGDGVPDSLLTAPAP